MFAEPLVVTALEECDFYHTMELPGYGTVPGQWDLRSSVDSYLGGVELQGKRVLEVGTASGFLCFEMEKRGAEVIAYDLSGKHEWDMVPYARLQDSADAQKKMQMGGIARINKSWWLAHRAFRSSARVVYGTVYEIPQEIGPVDVATFGCILLHLRDPFQALAAAARLVRDTIVVTEPTWFAESVRFPPAPPAEPPGTLRRRLLKLAHRLAGDRDWRAREEQLVSSAQLLHTMAHAPLARFLPNDQAGVPLDAWWFLSAATVCEMLRVLGFGSITLSAFNTALYQGKPQTLFTAVGRRSR